MSFSVFPPFTTIPRSFVPLSKGRHCHCNCAAVPDQVHRNAKPRNYTSHTKPEAKSISKRRSTLELSPILPESKSSVSYEGHALNESSQSETFTVDPSLTPAAVHDIDTSIKSVFGSHSRVPSDHDVRSSTAKDDTPKFDILIDKFSERMVKLQYKHNLAGLKKHIERLKDRYCKC